jgi:hypothetical protein
VLEWLKRNVVSRWSVCVVQDGYLVVAVADWDRAAASLQTLLLPMFARFGNPRKPYRICLNYNPTRQVVWIDATSFSADGLEAAFTQKLGKVDAKFSMRRRAAGAKLRFFDPFTTAEIDTNELFSRLWPAPA